jgi:predicted ATPase/DNA-binding CsgD family transcriptional regulator
LSARQTEIATLVAAGKSSREIAEALSLSPRTVDTHVAAIFQKLGINSRVELVAALFAASEKETEACENLPRKLTSFVGRQDEMAAVSALLKKQRLVTLVGIGGVGKTRLALQVAANEVAHVRDGVWFVDLAPLSDAGYITTAVAQALGFPLSADGDPLPSLLRQLKAKQTLLIFDNCEHVVEPVARVIAAIVRECPKVTILASSRQSLHIAGETTFAIPALTGAPAVELFLERARAVDDRFELTPENARAIEEICRRLDGIPLAIELAAARIRILRPQQLLDRLSDRFRLLANGSRDAMPRHQTLRALIDWSHDLLREDERFLFRRASVFVGGFTIEGAAALATTQERSIDAFDTLASLIDKSLVLAEPGGEAVRYRFLESARAYANEKLVEADEDRWAARQHLRYLRDEFAELRRAFEQTGGTVAINRAFTAYIVDVRQALDAALERDDVVVGAELLAAIGSLWVPLGLGREGRMRAETYLAAVPQDQTLIVARLSIQLSLMLLRAGRKLRALDAAQKAVTAARKAGDTTTLADALRVLATSGLSLTRLEEASKALCEAEALDVSAAGIRLALLRARAWLTMFSDPSAASPMYEQLLERYRLAGDPTGHLVTASNYAVNESIRGFPDRAIAITQHILSERRASADKWSLALSLSNFAGYLCATGDLPGAEAAARESIGLLSAIEPDSPNLAMAVEVLALVWALRGDCEFATILEAFANATFERHGFRREFNTVMTYDRLVDLLASSLTTDRTAELTREGAALSPEAAIALIERERARSRLTEKAVPRTTPPFRA